ncbi:hypothetical protein DAETH_46180 (plasmid) [Deinococcus aetherius]|uniref:Uncharacterized protein n=1 Tax=Deinococcus aetherius TaxID=200252 RepID=A0ABN6RPH3_9DEIO|nr:hypothetical protein [Deinococcus aetherius]BDP44649.1 hypothetical protein DAETH_46180 [Deinococcus aetherius]
MTKLSLGPWIAAQKLPSPNLARDRQAFLERVKVRAESPSVAGFPLLGTGGSCGKPAFALPYRVTWNEENTLALEEVACEFGCFVEYGVYPHLKLEDGGQEVAAVQDWSTFGTVYLRPGYERAEELLVRLAEVLAPQHTLV